MEEDRPSLPTKVPGTSAMGQSPSDTLHPHGSPGFYRQGRGAQRGEGVSRPRTHERETDGEGSQSQVHWLPAFKWDESGVGVSGPRVHEQSDSGYTEYLDMPVPSAG